MDKSEKGIPGRGKSVCRDTEAWRIGRRQQEEAGRGQEQAGAPCRETRSSQTLLIIGLSGEIFKNTEHGALLPVS